MSETRKHSMRISVGAMSDPISVQLSQQGISASDSVCVAWQKDADAINWLRIRGLITEAQAHSACKRLLKTIGLIATVSDEGAEQ